MPLLETYGNYQLVEKLAMGGMAQLYLARRRAKGTDRTVVLKRILPHLAEDTAFVTMFLDEARIAARLHHPNVIEILDLGAEGDSYFIAMEYIHGEDLRRITKRGIETNQRMPPPLVCRVVAEACRGLDYAHKRTDAAGRPLRIVHRDVSPQNILVGFDGSVKVVDFGIAKAVDKATVTASGVIKGKHAYMSPEQALGRDIDHRTDVFALGIVLFEALTATRLFRRATDLQTLKAVSECKVEPPSRVFPAVPQALDAILLKALTKDLNARYQTALQLAEALERWLGERSDGSRDALGAYVSDLFSDRLAREAREGKFLPTQSVVGLGSVPRPPNAPNAPTASIRPSQVNKTVTDKQVLPPSPLESRNTDVTPAFVPPDSDPEAPVTGKQEQFNATQLARPVLFTPEIEVELDVPTMGEPGGTTPYGRALGSGLSGGTAVYGSADPKTITELSERASRAIEAYSKPTAPAPVTQLRTLEASPRMWPWWIAAGLTMIGVAGGVAKLLVDRKDLLLSLRGPVAVSPPPSAPRPEAVDAGAVPGAALTGETVTLQPTQPTQPTEPGQPAPQLQPGPAEPPKATVAGPGPSQPPAAARKPMTPFGSVPVTAAAFPLARRQEALVAQLPSANALVAGENVRIIGPPRGGTRDRDFYGIGSVVDLKGNEARILFEDLETLPDGLFVSREDEGRGEAAAAPAAARGLALVGSLQLKQDDPQADVAVKNATDFDWTLCEVRLPDNRSLKLTGSRVVRAGNTQWITGAAFKLRGSASADARLAEGFGFVKCAEGDGYLKVGWLP